jgi:hypothetical protein
MFNAQEIYRRIKGSPFIPVRIRTSDGMAYDVYHPDLVIVGPRYVTVGTASSEGPQYADPVTRLGIIHVTALEDLPVPARPGGNGEAR